MSACNQRDPIATKQSTKILRTPVTSHMRALTLRVALIVILPIPVLAHESQPDWPTREQLANVTPAIDNSPSCVKLNLKS